MSRLLAPGAPPLSTDFTIIRFTTMITALLVLVSQMINLSVNLDNLNLGSLDFHALTSPQELLILNAKWTLLALTAMSLLEKYAPIWYPFRPVFLILLCAPCVLWPWGCFQVVLWAYQVIGLNDVFALRVPDTYIHTLVLGLFLGWVCWTWGMMMVFMFLKACWKDGGERNRADKVRDREIAYQIREKQSVV